MAADSGLNVLATLVKPLDGDALKYAFQWLHWVCRFIFNCLLKHVEDELKEILQNPPNSLAGVSGRWHPLTP